jgi:hypothetical protein
LISWPESPQARHRKEDWFYADTSSRLNRRGRGLRFRVGVSPLRYFLKVYISEQIEVNNMATESIDYAAVLADLEAKKAALESTIAGIRQMLNLGAELSGGGAPDRKEQTPAEVRSDTFFRMTMPDAIVKYLEIAKRPQTLSEITKALEDGGLPTTAKNLMPIVGSNMSRMKSAGELCQPQQGKWGLAAWYPAASRQAVAAKPKTKKRGRPKALKTAMAVKAKASTAEQKTAGAKLTGEQIARMKTLQAAGKTVGQIAKELGVHQFNVYRVLKPKSPEEATVHSA